MPTVTAQLIFTVLGPLFLLLGAWRCISAGHFESPGRTWVLIGVIFSAVAAWLWWLQLSE